MSPIMKPTARICYAHCMSYSGYRCSCGVQPNLAWPQDGQRPEITRDDFDALMSDAKPWPKPPRDYTVADRPWAKHDAEAEDPRQPGPAPEVDHPDHYTAGGIECIDAIRAALTDDEFRGFCKGNMLKYVWREKHKGGDTSLEKAGWYGRQLTEKRA